VATTGNYQGVAPGGNLVSVRVLGQQRRRPLLRRHRRYRVVVKEKSRYNIRVINLSLGAPPQSPYWGRSARSGSDGRLGFWHRGRGSGGNRGPQPMTINAPGNVPYVITVGAGH